MKNSVEKWSYKRKFLKMKQNRKIKWMVSFLRRNDPDMLLVGDFGLSWVYSKNEKQSNAWFFVEILFFLFPDSNYSGIIPLRWVTLAPPP